MSSMGKQHNCNLFKVSDVAYGPLAGCYFDFMFDFYERNACTLYYKYFAQACLLPVNSA